MVSLRVPARWNIRRMGSMIVPVPVGVVCSNEFASGKHTYPVQMNPVVVVAMTKECPTVESTQQQQRDDQHDHEPPSSTRPHEAGKHVRGVGWAAAVHV